jgi:glucosamine kinase
VRVNAEKLLLGIDGGGTACRARLAAQSGEILSESASGPANLRLGLKRSFSAAIEAAEMCLDRAELPRTDLRRVVACLALAGASEPSHLTAAKAYRHPFAKALITTDARAACIGAHGERDGGVIVIGTGSVGWAVLKGQDYRVGGWGLPVSDEGSGAWLGVEALRRVLWAYDGRIAWTPLLRSLFADFNESPHAIVHWTQTATPAHYGSFAPRVIESSVRGDPVGRELMKSAAFHIDALAQRLVAMGASRLSLVGGCAQFVQPWLADETKSHLVKAAGDALQGALNLARAETGLPRLARQARH